MSQYFDRTKYDHTPVTNIPNAFVVTEPGDPAPFTELTGVFEPLISKLARRHPNWRFMLIAYKDYPGTPKFTSAWVNFILVTTKDYDQTLGQLDYSSSMYQISNQRIRDAMTRKPCIATKDLAKALKTVEKYFYPKNDNEIVSELKSAASTAVQKVKQRVESARNQSVETLTSADMIKHAILPNLDLLLASPDLDPVTRDKAALLPERLEKARIARAQDTAVASGVKLLVRVEGDYVRTSTFTNWDTAGEFTDPMASSQLAGWLRSRLGMLKLVPHGTVLDDVGIRLDETSFLIFRNEGENK